MVCNFSLLQLEQHYESKLDKNQQLETPGLAIPRGAPASTSWLPAL